MPDKNSTWILEVLESYEASLLRYAARLLGDPDAAKDVVQETFLELCKTRRNQVEDHLAPWLFRVCRNRVLDLRRKEKRVQPLSDKQSQAMESPDPSPHAVIEQTQGEASLLSMVKTLPESQQEIIFLRFHAGLSYKEIADVTGHSVSNVGVLIHNAVRTIRDRMAQGSESSQALKGAL